MPTVGALSDINQRLYFPLLRVHGSNLIALVAGDVSDAIGPNENLLRVTFMLRALPPQLYRSKVVRPASGRSDRNIALIEAPIFETKTADCVRAIYDTSSVR